jgi:hypothetical protein
MQAYHMIRWLDAVNLALLGDDSAFVALDAFHRAPAY